MKAVIFGAGGIIGQHMMLNVLPGTQAFFFRKREFPEFAGRKIFEHLDLTQQSETEKRLKDLRPDVVINLAGSNSPDEVEANSDKHYPINVEIPEMLAGWCHRNQAHYVHISSQAVFDGQNPPYLPASPTFPINEYGRQKEKAEKAVMKTENWTILRLTFILGIRPLPNVGRKNPAEQMLEMTRQDQVNDRWFSILAAKDAAHFIWEFAARRPFKGVYHLGHNIPHTRYEIARKLNPDADIQPVNSDHFPGIAPRPIDTTYYSPICGNSDELIISRIRKEYQDQKRAGISTRARELAIFLNKSYHQCVTRLETGFGENHIRVAKDFKEVNPQTDDELLKWYLTTDSYLWELSAYHLDEGFNYRGMCKGIGEALQTKGLSKVLCLGDGIGDLSLDLSHLGLIVTYHDLEGSLTSEFARYRHHINGDGLTILRKTTNDWEPNVGKGYDVIVSLDFFEHLIDVPKWARKCYEALHQGGYLIAQNAFNIGSGPNGSIPCHLERNDRFEKDWQPLLEELGFENTAPNWWRKK